jgi:hypothetical protein
MKVNLSHSLPLVKHFGELHLRIAFGKAKKYLTPEVFQLIVTEISTEKTYLKPAPVKGVIHGR